MSETNRTTSINEGVREAVIGMAVESWRFGKVFDRLLTKLDAGEQSRYKRSVSVVHQKGRRGFGTGGSANS